MSVSGASRQRGWYYGWNVVLATIVSQITANGLGINSVSLFLRGWARDLHTPASQLLLAIPALGAAVAIASPVMGILADKYPARWLFGLGLAGIATFSLAMSAVTATWQIWALYGSLFPISITLCTTLVSNAVVSRWFDRRVGLALGLSAVGVGISGVILPPLIAAVMPDIGWRGVWRAAGLLTGLVVLPLVVWVVRDRPAAREGSEATNGENAGRAHHGHGRPVDEGDLRWIDILARRTFWLLVLCFIPIVGLYFGTLQNLAPIVASHGFDVKTAGMLLAILALFHVIATPLLGLVSDRFGNRLPLAGLAALALAGAGLVGYGPNLASLAIGVALIGFCGGVWTLIAAAVVVEFGAGGVGRAFGALLFCLPVNAAAATFIARTQEATGSYGPALLGLGVFCLVAAVSALLIHEKRGGHAGPAEREAALEDAPNPIA